MAGIGYSTLSVMPDMKGFGAKVAAETTPAMAAAGKSGGLAFGKAAIAGIAVIAAAGVVAVGAVFKIGESFEEARKTIRIGTGATGKDLASLQGDFRAVVKDVPASFGDASKAIADLNTRTGQTGPGLQALAKQTLEMTRLTGGDLGTNIASVTRVFGDWSIKTGAQSKTMDYLFKVSQSTGIGIDSLSSKVVQFGAPLRQLGFSFEESAALLGKWEKEGVNTEAVLAGMKIGLGTLSKAGVEPVAALKAIEKAIKGAGTAGEANKIAIKTFGQRAGPDMAAAIREGRFGVEDLMKTLKGSGETIMGAAKDTMTYKESWVIFKNKAMVELEPIATRVFQIFSDWMSWVSTEGIPTIKKFSGWFSDNLMPSIRRVADFVTGTAVPAIKTFFTFLSGNTGNEGAGRFTDIAKAGALVRDVLGQILPPVKVFFDFLIGNGASGAGRFTDVANAALSIRDAIGKVVSAVTDTALPALGNIATWITGTGLPALKDFGTWVLDNRDKLQVFATFIGVVLLPVFADMAVKAVASAATQVTAWVSAQVAGVTSAASQVVSHYKVVAGWVANGVAATASGAVTVAIWALYLAEGIANAPKVVAQIALASGAWVAVGVKAVAAGVKTAAVWLAMKLESAANAVKVIGQIALTEGAWVAMGVAATGAGTAAKAAWAMAMGPLGLLAGLIAGVIAGLKWIDDHDNPAGAKKPGGSGIGVRGGYPSQPGHNASGTDYWRGGPTWVGERGPEIVNLPQGSQVVPNHKLGGANGGATSADIAALGDRFGAELQRQARTLETMQRQMVGAR